jgi:hypothetical protein
LVVQSLEGKWTYRSFVNSTDLVGGDPNKAVALIFGEGVYTFETPSGDALRGTFDMGGGYVLDLNGTIHSPTPDSPGTVEIAGIGRNGTPTAGWEYDYYGYTNHDWPNAINKKPTLVGTVIRAKPHDGAPAGFVASFVAVKQG